MNYIKLCPSCIELYPTTWEHQIYCCFKCDLNFQATMKDVINQKETNIGQHIQNCEICRAKFLTDYEVKFCNNCENNWINRELVKLALTKPKRRQKQSLVITNKPVQAYVYGWYHPKEKLPFYIGKGRGRRAWDKHTINNFTLAKCQLARTTDTVIKIYMDDLTNANALLIEELLIRVYTENGAILINNMAYQPNSGVII